MKSSSLSRGNFLLSAAAAQLLAATEAKAQPSPSSVLPRNLKRSLVLSGGGALGAYEAGAVQSLVLASGVREGQPLPQYGIITGTSIGAFNGYLAATAQWSKLEHLWSSIADQNVVRPKPQFAKIGNQSSGVLNRLGQIISLGTGAGKNVLGVYDGDYLETWLSSYFDFSLPVVTPFVWAVTNLTLKTQEYFYLMPPGFDPELQRLALASIRLGVGRIVPIRKADPALLVKQLRASAAVPIAFDPVFLPGPDGKIDQYVDGGVTANTPIAVASAVSSAVDAVLLSPVFQREDYHDIFEVTSGSFDTMQRRLMFDSVRSAAGFTLLYRAVRSMSDADLTNMALGSGYELSELRAFSNLLYDTKYYVLRPEKELPATLFGFDDSKSIHETYALGLKDANAGFKEFRVQDLQI